MKNNHFSSREFQEHQNAIPSWSARARRLAWVMVIFAGSACSTAPSARGAGPAGRIAASDQLSGVTVPSAAVSENEAPSSSLNSSTQVAGAPAEQIEAIRTAVDTILTEGQAPTAAVVLAVNPKQLIVNASRGDISASKTALPPGSTVKPLLYAAALLAGELQPEEPLACSGKLPGEGSYDCYATHGNLTLPLALATSCNVYAWRAVDRLGWPRLRSAFERAGLGMATGLENGEASGVVPALQTDDPQKLSRLVGLGHGEIRVTALQLAAAYAKLVTAPEWGSDKLAALREGMRLVVEGEHGTGRAAAVPGLEILGKTGTAEDPEHPGTENGFFVGIAPADAPRWIVVAVVRGAGSGGKTAAPVVARVFSEYLKHWPGETRGAGAPSTSAL